MHFLLQTQQIILQRFNMESIDIQYLVDHLEEIIDTKKTYTITVDDIPKAVIVPYDEWEEKNKLLKTMNEEEIEESFSRR